MGLTGTLERTHFDDERCCRFVVSGAVAALTGDGQDRIAPAAKPHCVVYDAGHGRTGGMLMNDLPAVVFVVDDDRSMRESLEMVLRSVKLHAQAFASPQEFLAAARPDAPGCLILDVRMPGSSGLDLQQQLVDAGIELPIIFLTGHADVRVSVRAMKAGAIEFLTKPVSDQELLDAVHQALARSRTSRASRAERADLQHRYESLTSREREVLHLVSSGLLNKQIAGELGISIVTVKLHRGRVMQKMGAGSLAELVKMVEKVDPLPRSPMS